MSINQVNFYDTSPYIAEIYDQCETYQDDVALIRRLIQGRGNLCILEPFCGTGRILIPLASDGHTLMGMDQSKEMLARAREKVRQLPAEIQTKITLLEADAVAETWPIRFDLIVLGGNCFFELAAPEEQERCIAYAAQSLHAGGHVYIDNDHMEGELDESWQDLGEVRRTMHGTCADGTQVECTLETIWYDVQRRLVRFRRQTIITSPAGERHVYESRQQKHPVSAVEVLEWLNRYRFVVEGMYGDRETKPYSEESERAIFWARKLPGDKGMRDL